MDTPEHRERLHAVADRFAATLAAAAADGALTTTVVTCPDWTIRDLAEHLGGIYRWMTTLVEEGIVAETWRSELPIPYPSTDAEVAPWFTASIPPLVEALRAAPPDRPVWGWGADPHARFHSRRLLHETTVHLGDLLATMGQELVIDPEVAADGIDEFLTNLPSTARWGAPLDRLRGDGELLGLRATDRASSWRIRFEPTGFWWDRASTPTDTVVTGSATDLLLWIQGRARPVEFSGRADLVGRWLDALDF